jgi:hypothetical protein
LANYFVMFIASLVIGITTSHVRFGIGSRWGANDFIMCNLKRYSFGIDKTYKVSVRLSLNHCLEFVL